MISNSKGSGILYAIVALGILTGMGYYMMSQTSNHRKNLKSINLKQSLMSFGKNIAGILSREEFCNANFSPSQKVNSNPQEQDGFFDFIKVGDLKIFQKEKIYSNGMVKIKSMQFITELDDETGNPSLEKFKLLVTVVTDVMGGKRNQERVFRYSMIGELNNAYEIQSCVLDTSHLTESIINNALLRLCQGPGAKWDNVEKACKVASFEAIDCNAGQSIMGISYNEQSRRFKPTCGESFPPLNCNFGFRYLSPTEQGQRYKCLTLGEMVNTTSKINVAEGSSCKIVVNSQSKLALSCGASP